jgi:hypothetical protein
MVFQNANPFVAERKKNIGMLREMLDASPDTNPDTILSRFCMQRGVTLKTAKQYLDIIRGDSGEL